MSLAKFFDIRKSDNLLGKGSISRSGKSEVGIKRTGHLVIKKGIRKQIGKDEVVLTHTSKEGDILGILLETRKEGVVSKEHKHMKFRENNKDILRGGETGIKPDLEQEAMGPILPFSEQLCQPCKQGNPNKDSKGKTVSKVKGIPTELAFIQHEGLEMKIEGDDVMLYLDLTKGEARKNDSPTG